MQKVDSFTSLLILLVCPKITSYAKRQFGFYAHIAQPNNKMLHLDLCAVAWERKGPNKTNLCDAYMQKLY